MKRWLGLKNYIKVTLCLLVLIVATGCNAGQSAWLTDYNSLLAEFQRDNQGLGLEPAFSECEMTHQPMTYGLIISAESLHYLAHPTKESEYQIKSGLRWLLDNADLNRDGYPGWGLPQAWDAFSDGTVNPENHPYTITTAIVLQALTDALSIPSLWTEMETKEIQEVIKDTSLYWCQNVWTGKGDNGFFWYSISSSDAYFCPNVSAMILGTLSRIVSEQKEIFTDSEVHFIQDRVDKAAKGLVLAMDWHSEAPFWTYISVPNDLNINRPNDILHHTYILWGMELYRSTGGRIELPWSTSQAIESLNCFWKNKAIYEYPQDISTSIDRPARLWGVGMAQAFYTKYSALEKATLCLEVVKDKYGFPRPRIYPRGFTEDEQFYPRYAAHVLYGMAQIFSLRN